MDTLLVISLVAWLIVIPWILAVWFSPAALIWIKRRLVARADALTASRAAYEIAHAAAMGELRWQDERIFEEATR